MQGSESFNLCWLKRFRGRLQSRPPVTKVVERIRMRFQITGSDHPGHASWRIRNGGVARAMHGDPNKWARGSWFSTRFGADIGPMERMRESSSLPLYVESSIPRAVDR